MFRTSQVVAQLIEPKDDLVTVDIKKMGSTTSKYILIYVANNSIVDLNVNFASLL